MKKIRCIAFDVDGTLTDGQVHISADGELYKSFDIKDGYGIRNLLAQRNVEAAIITGRQSKIVALRAKELAIKFVYQDVQDKAIALKDLQQTLGIGLDEIAYMGDDLNDLPVMQMVGTTACPSNAVSDVKRSCTYVCNNEGGRGAAREFIEWLIVKRLI